MFKNMNMFISFYSVVPLSPPIPVHIHIVEKVTEGLYFKQNNSNSVDGI